MTRVALAGLLGRKLRTALTAIAIVLGVAMVTGTFILTDSIDKAFNSIFTDVRKGSDIVVSGKAATSTDNGSTAPTLPASLLAQVRGLPDVAVAEGQINGEAQLIGHDGKAIVFGGAPNLGFSIADGASRFNPLTLVSGTWPHGPTGRDRQEHGEQEALRGRSDDRRPGDEARRKVEDLRPREVRWAEPRRRHPRRLRHSDAQKLFDKPDQFDEIAIATKSGASSTNALKEVRAILPSNAQALTGKQQADKDAENANSFISFLRGFLLAFGGIALFVGSFVIANSLSITIAQRTRELATLRTLGASRRQVLNSIFVEALVVGTLASLVGIAVGFALAKGLFKLFDAVGFTLPNSGLVFATRTVIIALLVGILVTLIASLRPAIRATRVQPIAAVREGATLPESRFARFARSARPASHCSALPRCSTACLASTSAPPPCCCGWASVRS